ncbi:MAG: flagellar basal body rod protein FlgB [Thermoguttaceae bacterium]
MMTNLFTSTTIPMMEEVAKFSQLRHTTLAGNIANLDTPDYQFRDLSVDDFHSRLKEAVEARRRPVQERHDPYLYGAPGGPSWQTESAPVSPNHFGEFHSTREPLQAAAADEPHTILYHDKSNVELEQQVSEMVKNQMQHNLALTVMNQQFRLLTTAISGRL